ncbi:hypothetical protein HGRIS_002175 [Hohenbuehelia grisea]|uniref:Phospholipid:diacylglycerol acyltransferase n=1 Tax=Hohenbuehelia grisea TaxID=104357 RepID=A0ABR3JJQ5_9AGAR
MVANKRAKTWSGADAETDLANATTDLQETLEEVKTKLHDKEEELKAVQDDEEEDPKALKKKKKDNRSFFATRRFLFSLGISLGLLIGFMVIQADELQEMHAQLALLVNEFDVSIPPLPGLDFSRVGSEWQRLRANIPEVWKFNRDGREFEVGEAMKARGLSAKYPVVLIPGVISTGLESWSTSPDYRDFFRQKLWGGFNMISQVTFNRDKWIAAMMLDPVTGLDPPDAKIRAAEGIDAASSFIQGYWIWSKIVENLAVVNYDTNNLYLAPYDWRLSYYNLEERDGYFSKLKATIEGFKRRQKKKTVIAAHSMGSTVLLVSRYVPCFELFLNHDRRPYDLVFVSVNAMIVRRANIILNICLSFKWVESPKHGAGGPDWVENHIEATITIAGTHLVSSETLSIRT